MPLREGGFMKYVRSIAAPCALIALIAFAAGCQSVATTSAKLRNQEGNYELAIDLARQALAQNPQDAEAYFQLGVSYSNLDSVALAYENFMKAAELDPKKKPLVENNVKHNFAKHYKLGQSAFNRSDYTAAAREFELATEADPRQAVAYYNLGVAYARLAQDDPSYREKAIAAADKVLELQTPSDANYIKALQLAGRELVRAGRAREAEERFRRLIDEDPSQFLVIENIGTDLLKQREWEGAVVFLKMAAEARAKVNEEDFNLYYNIGAALYNMRKEDPSAVDEAIAYYQKALTLQEDEPQTLFNIAVAYVYKEDYGEAVSWLERYTSIKPTDYRGWQLLARCYSETGQKTKARDAMERFQQLRQQ
ncbi:MAG: hypothetical protein D6760_02470 [Deltaproteobacteria bacterium]|nr:MAG: hypothetical protein D6760_02470 [Deltaproteobacteria bacterium]